MQWPRNGRDFLLPIVGRTEPRTKPRNRLSHHSPAHFPAGEDRPAPRLGWTTSQPVLSLVMETRPGYTTFGRSFCSL